MSITLSHEMFSKLSKSCQDEILRAFTSGSIALIKEKLVPQATAFESASLTYGKPLILPDYNRSENVIRLGPATIAAKASDLYSVAPLEKLSKICREIDNGLFISRNKNINWSEGGIYHHRNWDVKRVVMEVKYIQPATASEINKGLQTMDRHRVSSILRELRNQGILVVS